MSSQNNTRIVVRIRNTKEEIGKKSKGSSTVKNTDDKKVLTTTSKLNAESKQKDSGKTKSTQIQVRSKLNQNAKYTIFTSMIQSNVCVVTNNPISGKLLEETFHTSNEIYDYSINLMNDSSILEFDTVYSEQHK